MTQPAPEETARIATPPEPGGEVGMGYSRDGGAAPDASTPPPPRTAPRPRADRSDPGRSASIIFGILVLAVGLWFFADVTLGLELPRVRWSQLWPVILIAIGVWVVLGSVRRGSR